MNHITLPLLAALMIFGTPTLLMAKSAPQCPKTHENERLAYSTHYPDGSLRCTYVPNIYGLKQRES